MSAMSNYLENKIIDWLFRAQAFTPPATMYVALHTATPSDTGGGTEVSTSSTGYARVGVTSALANWAGTQSAGSTTASSGTGGTTSNNAAITFGAPIADWGRITHFGIYDASTGGNLLFYGALDTAKNVNNGDASPSYAISALTVQIDD